MTEIPFNKSQGEVNVTERLQFLDRKQRHAVLATVSNGRPYTSLVAFALTPDATGLLFATPKKTTKYTNMLKNSNVSILIDSRKNTAKGYMESEAVTITGTATAIRKGRRRDMLAGIFREKHPELGGFVNAASTALVLVAFDKIIHAGKFQIISKWQK
ncbi:MAG: pyridoxamine 5'-phosphate oxidase family protein [Nitrospiraceae bacterium]|nr:MAG: pyridoxamine 5'-phosphate oxidase family protein [Nitrospiraceae bacterium]